MKTVKVTGFTLKGPATYSVVSVNCTWAVGGLPSANIVVATGRQFRGGGSELFDLDKEGRNATWNLVLNTSAGSFNILTGFIIAVNRTAISSPSGSRTNTQVSLISSAYMLTTMRAGNYHYWRSGIDGTDPEIRKTGTVPSLPLPNANGNALLAAVMKRKNKDINALVTDIPELVMGVLSVMYGVVTREQDSDKTMAEIAKYFDVSNGAGLRTDITGLGKSGTMPRAISEWMAITLKSSNVYQVLQEVAGNLMLTMVPVRDKVQMRALLPWKNTADFSISGSTCMEMTAQSDLASQLNRTQAVQVVHSGATEANAFAGSGNIAIGPVYPESGDLSSLGPILTINLPSWIHSLASFTYVGTKSKDPDRRLDYDEDKMKDIAASGENASQIGMAVAKTYFATHANMDTKLALRVPINMLSFMDKLGYIIQVSNMEVTPEGGKQTIYGMLNSISLEARITADSGSIRVSIGLANVRSEGMNDAYGVDAHPLFVEKSISTASSSSTGSLGLGGGISSTGGLGSLG